MFKSEYIPFIKHHFFFLNAPKTDWKKPNARLVTRQVKTRKWRDMTPARYSRVTGLDGDFCLR